MVPLAYSGVLYLTRGRFENVEDLLNRAEPASEISFARDTTPEQITTTAHHYDPLTTGALGFLAMCVLVGGLRHCD